MCIRDSHRSAPHLRATYWQCNRQMPRTLGYFDKRYYLSSKRATKINAAIMRSHMEYMYCSSIFCCQNTSQETWCHTKKSCTHTPCLKKRHPFYRASICEGGLGSRNSVCLSVCLSVTRVDCDKTKWRTADIFYTTRKGNHSATLIPRVVDGRRPLPSEICVQSDPPPFEKRRLRTLSLSALKGGSKSDFFLFWV